jgi:hypothetical protein
MESSIPATLYLNTSMISTPASTASVSNEIGFWDVNRQTFGFNIKLRQLLGANYEKYDKFILSIIKYNSINEANITNPILLEIQIGGLNWFNSSYNQVSRANNYWAPFVVEFTPAALNSNVTRVYASLSNCLMFRKSNDDVRLEFRCIDGVTRGAATPASGFLPSFSFMLKIQPMEEDK